VIKPVARPNSEPGGFIEPPIRRRIPIPILREVDLLSGVYAPNAIRPAPISPFGRTLVQLVDAVVLAGEAFEGDIDVRRAWAACHIARRAADGDLPTFFRNSHTLRVSPHPHTFWLNGLDTPGLAAVFQTGGILAGAGSIYVDRKRLLELCPPGAALNLGGRAHASPTPQRAVPSPPQSGFRTNTAEKAEDACRRWISSLRERPANKDKAFESAQATYPDLSRKAFDRAWAQAAPTVWRNAGRPKKSTPV